MMVNEVSIQFLKTATIFIGVMAGIMLLYRVGFFHWINKVVWKEENAK